MRKLWLGGLALAIVGCGGGSSSPDTSPGDWVITPAGGYFYSANDAVTLIVPGGGVTSNTIVHEAPMQSAPSVSGMQYLLYTGYTYSPTVFAAPATLQIYFGNSFTAAQENTIAIYRQEDGTSTWTPVETTIDHSAKTASVQISSFSSYAAFYDPTAH